MDFAFIEDDELGADTAGIVQPFERPLVAGPRLRVGGGSLEDKLAVMGKPAAADPAYPHLTVDAQGSPILAGSTMKVAELVMAQQAHGWSPEELHFQFPSLPLGQVHAALAYYWDHKDELDADIERRSRYAEQARQEAGPSPLAAKLRRISR